MRSRIRPAALIFSALFGFGAGTFSWAHDMTAVNGAAAPTSNAVEATFLAENNAAMTKMMADMDIQPTGDVDRDFVAMMAPHHQGAIDMARVLLRHGHNEQLRRLAQEIIVTRQQEIVAMRLAIGDKLPPAAAAPTQMPAAPSEAAAMHHHTKN